MKNIIIALGIIMFSSINISAQHISESKVPSVVVSAFKTKFPAATNISWEKENATEYEANFKAGNSEGSAAFDPTGKWLSTETKISNAALPKAVSGTISSQFSGYSIKAAEKVETPDKGTFYEVNLYKGKEELEVQLSTDGKVLKQKKEDKD